MGKGGGGSSQPTQQNVTQTNLPEYAKPYFENIMQRAQAESYRPYTPYGGERIAPFTPEQTEVRQEVSGLQTPGQFQPASQLTGLGGLSALGFGGQGAGAGQQYFNLATSPGAQQAFMSPYMQNVVDVQKQEAIRDAQKGQLAANLAAARTGTYGGARQTLAMTERERNLGQQLAQIQATGGQKAFEAAQQAQQFGSELGLKGLGLGLQGAQAATQAGLGLGELGAREQATNIQRLQAQAAAAAEPRQFEQQRLDQQYADFLRQRDYPMEQLGYYSNLLRGIPIQLGSTTTTYAQPPSLASQVGGLGLAGLGLYNLAGRG